uniref:Solute carrier family 26 member 6 n=1 Tax=Saimiri boliviensis boliviensis TaxID=39432 RepID=A0A2K6TAP5_SAIBB
MGLADASGPRDTQALLPATQAMELRKRDYHMERPLLNQEHLEELGHRGSAPRARPWQTWLRCSRARAHALLLQHLPILVWLPRYPVRDWLLGDLLSGLSVAIMQLPQGLAYALLAGLPPVFGLYSSFYPVFIYFLFGTSRHISVGPLPPLTAPDRPTGRARPGPLRLRGHLPVRASRPRLYHSCGCAGLRFPAQVCVWASSEQPLWATVPHLLLEVCWKLPQSKVGTMVTAAVAGVVLVLVKLLNDKLQQQLPMPVPGELLTLIGATSISYGMDLKQKFDVDVVGNIPTGLVPPVAPNSQLFSKLMGSAFAIALVGFAIAISLGKIFALRHGYRVDSNQELVALGLSNLIGGIFQCFPVSCSMSRSLVQESTGGNSQVAGAISSLFILLIIVKLGELFHCLPKAVLAAIVIVNLKGMLRQLSDVCSLWKANRADLLIWLVTFMATILLNLDLGLVAAVIFSLLLVVVRTQRPHYSILGQVPDTDIYRDVAEYSEAKEVPGVKVFRSSATMYFANAEFYSDALKQRCGVDVDLLISQKKKLLKKQEQLKLKQLQKEKKLQKQAASSKDTSVSINVNTSLEDMRSNDAEDCKAMVSPGDKMEDATASGQEDSKAADVATLKALGLPQPDFHSLILDLSALSFVDTVCLKSLKNIFRDFREIEVEVYMAACHSPVVSQLEAGHFFDASITKKHLFASVHDAVTFALQHPRPVPNSRVSVSRDLWPAKLFFVNLLLVPTLAQLQGVFPGGHGVIVSGPSAFPAVFG